MIRLIASDLDDTLLNRDGQISGVNREVIREAVAQGIVFTIVTGRMFKSAVPFALELGLDRHRAHHLLQRVLDSAPIRRNLVRKLPVP